MIIEIGGKHVELAYTFNSTKYMGDLDLGEFSEMEGKPFKVLNMLSILLYGACNSTPRVKVTELEVSDYLEKELESGDITELMTNLVKLLEDSNFFKKLQGKQ